MAATESTPSTSAEQTSGAASTAVTMLPNGTATLRQKRARSQLSCTPCRTGKLKCNREKPSCDQCIKRNRESACAYVPPPAKHKPVQNVKGRIRQLESLVVDLMNQNRQGTLLGDKTQGKEQQLANGAPTSVRRQASGDRQGTRPFSELTPPSDNDTSPQLTDQSREISDSPQDEMDAAVTPFGQMKISKNEISYVGEGHWNAILDSISDLKRELADDDNEEVREPNDKFEEPELTLNRWSNVPMGGTQPHATTGLGFMLGDSNNVTKEQLVAAVPEKRVADRLLSLWFNSPDPFKPIVHAPTFQEEYKRFWRSPKDTPVMWLGLLFSIMSLAASFGLRDSNPSSPQAQAVLAEVNKYHSMAASAAVLADFTKPKQYTIECLILYAAGLRSNNAFVNVWLMIGLIVRLGLRMGYHRDPSHYSAITVFQGEMRRRVWAIIHMIDVLISFQLGLPSMVKTIQADTQAPRNLLDRDFSPSSSVLPPSRGIDELTPSSYTRAKLRIVRIFAKASELSHATVPPAYEEMMQLDRELEEAKALIPPLLQMPDISELVTDPAEQLMCRFNLDLLYLKTKTTLHRRYMLTPTSQLSPVEQQLGIGRSRKTCIECALRVLQHHHTIYSASQHGGQLESVKWYMGSISTHDFLLAAMIICLELNSQINNANLPASQSRQQCPQRRAMMDALEKSQQIWSDASGRKKRTVGFTSSDNHSQGEHLFDETEKASRAMAVMLEKVKKQFGTQAASSGRMPRSKGDVDATTSIVDPGRWYSTGMAKEQAQNPQFDSQAPLNDGASNIDWNNLAEVPQLNAGGLDLSGAPFTNVGSAGGNGMAYNPVTFGNDIFGNSMSSSTDTSPDQDFAMIGDMLDVDAANLDWQMWDNEITNAQQVQMSGWSDLPPDSVVSSSGSDLSTMRFGNVLVGGSGPDMQTPVAGNATIPGRTGPIPNNRFDLSQIGAMDFDMNGPLQDANFDLGGIDYSRMGM